MQPNEIEKLRTLAEISRKLRRENERLREQLGQLTESQRKFDAETEELFRMIEKNRKRSLSHE